MTNEETILIENDDYDEALNSTICEAAIFVENFLLGDEMCEHSHEFFHYILYTACHAIINGDNDFFTAHLDCYWEALALRSSACHN